jgi:hypothetical protein
MTTFSIPLAYADVYNSLPIVEQQFQLFKDNNDIDLLFKSISQMNIPKDVINKYGLFLNHKHWEVGYDQIMMETAFEDNQIRGLKTRGIKLPIAENLVPIRWKVMKESNDTNFFMPLEFSNDIGAKNVLGLFNKHITFFQQVAKEICDFQLESLLGVAILTRSHITPNVQDEIYLEVSKHNESIVTLHKRAEENEKQSIPTTWSFDLIKEMECKTFCKLNTYCSTEWACWMEDDEHVRGQNHTASSSHETQHYPA